MTMFSDNIYDSNITHCTDVIFYNYCHFSDTLRAKLLPSYSQIES